MARRRQTTGGSEGSGGLRVREMLVEEVGIRIEYLHGSSDEYLRMLGVERARLPSPGEWHAFYEQDYRRPLEERLSYALVWELDGEVVGFSSTDRIAFGREAYMHLHVLDPDRRRRGLGTAFVQLSAGAYFDALRLERLYCEPNAFNVAPNRTLQRAGFRYLLTHEAQPGPINYPQVTTVWVLTREAWRALTPTAGASATIDDHDEEEAR